VQGKTLFIPNVLLFPRIDEAKIFGEESGVGIKSAVLNSPEMNCPIAKNKGTKLYQYSTHLTNSNGSI
jgi:hypothetical protein